MSRWYRLGARSDSRWPGGIRAAAVGVLVAIAATAAVVQHDGPVQAVGPAVATHGAPEQTRGAVPVRITIGSLGIDLPVVSSEMEVRGNVPGYPLCDVAQYWTLYDLPGAPGTTWIYAHARPGMFLPLLDIAEATDGAGLMNLEVTLQLADGRLLTYRIDTVRQHAVDRSIGRHGDGREQRLVLQTSEGPAGTIPKLQLAGQLVAGTRTDEPGPEARPRACSSPPGTDGPDRPRTHGPSASPVSSPSAGPASIELGPIRLAPTRISLEDLIALLLGAGLVLAGVALLAWGIIGRRV